MRTPNSRLKHAWGHLIPMPPFGSGPLRGQ